MDYFREKISKTIKDIEKLDYLGHVKERKKRMSAEELKEVEDVEKRIAVFLKNKDYEGLKKFRDHIVKTKK